MTDQIRARDTVPESGEIADLRPVPLAELAADPGGEVSALVSAFLDDDDDRPRVATFNSCI